MKIEIKHASAVAFACLAQAASELEPHLIDEERRGADALKNLVNQHLIRVFAELEPWKPVATSRLANTVRYILRDQTTAKLWCRRGTGAPVRYKTLKAAQAMCDRLNESRLRHGRSSD